VGFNRFPSGNWTDRNISVTANISGSNQLIVGAKYGFARLNQSTGELSYIHEVWGEEGEGGKAER
jgi:hypothetical protein